MDYLEKREIGDSINRGGIVLNSILLNV